MNHASAARKATTRTFTLKETKTGSYRPLPKLPRYEQNLVVNVTFYCSPRPKLPDLDNLIKSLLDGLQKGGVFKDDVQVVEINARRMLDKGKPRVELSLVPL